MLQPALETLAPPNGWAHVGPSGAGHFVKMVHNGIEYGLMQAYAEGFEVMNASEFDLDLQEIASIWRYGSVVRSWLLELLRDALEQHGNDLGDIAGYVEDSGEGRWTIFEAINEDVPVPVISAALYARFASRQDESFAAKIDAALRQQFGGHAVKTRNDAQRCQVWHRPCVDGPRRRVPRTAAFRLNWTVRCLAPDGPMTETQVQPNPLLDGLGPRRAPEPCVLVIFGASGDLTHRKIFPSLYALACRKLLPEKFAIVGAARSQWTDDEFRDQMEHAVREFGRDDFKPEVWKWLAEATRYISLDFSDESRENELSDLLNEIDEERGTRGNRVYYFAVPPQAMPTLVRELGERRTTEGWTRLIVEKPFGHDLASARELTQLIGEHFAENEVFRIDHYLGKETVQNMLALRFANGIFEPIWNRQFVDHIQITVAETLGIEGRADYYEHAGAIRDIFQNHLLQLVALTAMEPPIDFTAESVRNEKVKVLKAMPTPGPRQVVRGQYGPGYIEGKEVVGYRDEEKVDPASMTDTFIAAKLYVDNWRWADTPIYVRLGKRLARRETTIAIQFKRAPHPPFEDATTEELQPNLLLVHVQPDEGVSLAIGAKVPGQGMRIRTVHMDFLYGGAFRTELPDAYERLILDAMLGDQTLFTRSDEVEEQWSLVDAIVAAWARDRPAFPNYAAGTWGPAAADELIRREGREWLRH